MWKTTNGGVDWRPIFDGTGVAAIGAIAVSESDPNVLYVGTGDANLRTNALSGSGVFRSSDAGESWTFLGLADTRNVARIVVHPTNPDVVYSSCTDGGISRYDHRTGRLQSVEPWPGTYIGHGAARARYRFQWTAPILFSRHERSTLYMAGNVLFRTRNGGMSWDVVSPDLTRNDPETLQPSGGPLTRDNVGTEFYGTIYALEDSPVAPGVFWAGTDDGLVHVTRDSGSSWSDVTPRELPPFSRVHAIDASPHDAGAAYARRASRGSSRARGNLSGGAPDGSRGSVCVSRDPERPPRPRLSRGARGAARAPLPDPDPPHGDESGHPNAAGAPREARNGATREPRDRLSGIESRSPSPGWKRPRTSSTSGPGSTELAALMGMVSASDRAPTSQTHAAFEELDRRLQEELLRLERLVAEFSGRN